MCALAAIIIEDLTLIFGIIAGLAECTTVFILPSIFYLKACRMEDQNLQAEQLQRGNKVGGRSSKSPLTRCLVFLYLLMGILYFVISNYFNIAKIFR